MLNPRQYLFLFALLFTSFALQAGQLNQAAVSSMLTQLDKSIQAKDANAVANLMSENIQITINVTSQGKTQIISVGKNEYIGMLSQGWTMAEEYSYKRENVNIKIIDQGKKAHVTADVIETVTIQGQKHSGKSKEDVLVEMIDGKPMITRITGETSM